MTCQLVQLCCTQNERGAPAVVSYFGSSPPSHLPGHRNSGLMLPLHISCYPRGIPQAREMRGTLAAALSVLGLLSLALEMMAVYNCKQYISAVVLLQFRSSKKKK